MKTVNRGKLLKDAQAGLLEGKVIIAPDPMRDSITTPRMNWLPVRVKKGYGDFVDGYLNLLELDFKSHTGHASEDEHGIIHLHVHSNSSMELRYKAIPPKWAKKPEPIPPVQVEIWYWRDTKYLAGNVPTALELQRDYAVMWRGTQAGVINVDRLFSDVNQHPENYFSQADVKQKLQPHPHTSMSVGDIIVVNGRKFLCQFHGWKEI
jgi:hypothetical protein